MLSIQLETEDDDYGRGSRSTSRYARSECFGFESIMRSQEGRMTPLEDRELAILF